MQQHYICCPVARIGGRRWLGIPPMPMDAISIVCIVRVLGAGGMGAMRTDSWLDALVTAVYAYLH